MSVAWTHTLSYDDVRAMLAVAQEGDPVAVWRKKAAEASRLPAVDRRKTQIRFAERILRPIDGQIVANDFLSDLQTLQHSNEPAAHDLTYARYLAGIPLAVTLARALIAPRANLPSAARFVSRADLDAALISALPGNKPSTIARSRTATLTEFSRAGIIMANRDGSFEILRHRLAPIAFYYLLRDDLAERGEATDAWISRASLPAALFALVPEQVNHYLHELVEARRLRRSYYAGEPRILAA